MYQLYAMQSLPKLVVRITIRILKNLIVTIPCSFLYYRDGWNENICMALFELIFVSGALIIVNIKTSAGLKTHLIRKKKEILIAALDDHSHNSSIIQSTGCGKIE